MIKRNPKYPDILLFLILIPIISGINYHLTYSNIQFNGFFILTYAIDTFIGYVAWIAIRRLVFYLDVKYPFSKNLVKRIMTQILVTVIVGFVIIAGLTEISSILYKGELAPIHFYTQDMIIISIWFFVLSGIYIIMHFYYEFQQSENKAASTQFTKKSNSIHIKQGKKSYQIDPNGMSYFKKQGDYVMAYNDVTNKFILDFSLDKLETLIDSNHFYRINRQSIIRRDRILGFDRLDYGKLKIITTADSSFIEEEIVSRNKAPDFKHWFNDLPVAIQPE